VEERIGKKEKEASHFQDAEPAEKEKPCLAGGDRSHYSKDPRKGI